MYYSTLPPIHILIYVLCVHTRLVPTVTAGCNTWNEVVYLYMLNTKNIYKMKIYKENSIRNSVFKASEKVCELFGIVLLSSIGITVLYYVLSTLIYSIITI